MDNSIFRAKRLSRGDWCPAGFGLFFLTSSGKDNICREQSKFRVFRFLTVRTNRYSLRANIWKSIQSVKYPFFVGRIRGCLRFYFTRPFQPVSTDRIAAETDTNRSKSDNTSVLNNGDFRLAIYRGLKVRSETGGWSDPNDRWGRRWSSRIFLCLFGALFLKVVRKMQNDPIRTLPVLKKQLIRNIP